MAHYASSNSRGYTLVEVIISMAILAIVATALMKSSVLVMQSNQQNEIRDEAIRLTTQRMNECRFWTGGFDTADTTNHLDMQIESYNWPSPVVRTIRGGTVSYTLSKNVVSLGSSATDATADARQITITATWMYRGKQYTHATTSIVRRFLPS